MKRIWLLFLLCVFCLSGCKDTEVVLDLSTYPLEETACIIILDMTTGADVRITDANEISALCTAAQALRASAPVSARGYAGSTYNLKFYESAEPTYVETPLLDVSLFPDDGNWKLLFGYYETVNGHDYTGLYTVTEPSAAAALDTLCGERVP